MTSRFLVMIVTGLTKLDEHRQAPAGQPEPPLHRLIGVGHPAQAQNPRPPSRRRQRVPEQFGASCLTMIFVSKSSPAEKPRYSCVGRA